MQARSTHHFHKLYPPKPRDRVVLTSCMDCEYRLVSEKASGDCQLSSRTRQRSLQGGDMDFVLIDWLRILCGAWFIPHLIGKGLHYEKAGGTFEAAGFRP